MGQKRMKAAAPLAGVRVLDLGQVWAGPLLGDRTFLGGFGGIAHRRRGALFRMHQLRGKLGDAPFEEDDLFQRSAEQIGRVRAARRIGGMLAAFLPGQRPPVRALAKLAPRASEPALGAAQYLEWIEGSRDRTLSTKKGGSRRAPIPGRARPDRQRRPRNADCCRTWWPPPPRPDLVRASVP